MGMINFEHIQQLVCIGEGILPQTLQTKSRKREIVFARQLIMYFNRKYTLESQALTGSRFGKDHATVLHACNQINNLFDTDANIKAKILLYDYKFQSLVDFEKNIITDKVCEIKDILKARIDNSFPISLESVMIYNKLLEKVVHSELI